MIITPCPIPHRPDVAVRSSAGHLLGRLIWSSAVMRGCCDEDRRQGAYLFRPCELRCFTAEEMVDMTAATIAANEAEGR